MAWVLASSVSVSKFLDGSLVSVIFFFSKKYHFFIKKNEIFFKKSQNIFATFSLVCVRDVGSFFVDFFCGY